jgi:AraC-like DNA-binding protein
MLLTPDVFQRLCRARDMLGHNPEDMVSIRDVATEIELSPFYFIRQFEALFGLTPHQFRIRARLDRAKRLLADGDLSVTAVCMEIGFSSLGSFSDMFSRRVGASPSAYRRRARAFVQVPGKIVAWAAPGCLDMIAHLPPSAFTRPKSRARNFGEAGFATLP